MLTQKAKHFRTAAILVILGLIFLKLAGPDAPVFWGLAVGLLFCAIFPLVRALWGTVTQSSGELDAMGVARTLPYKNFFADTGIALDSDKRELHLYEKPTYRVYPFDAIRNWSINQQSGGQVYATGAAVALGNIATARSNEKASGLFIEVKDIDHPRWRVAFAPRSRDKELARWMEILRQHVNEDK